MRLPPLAVGREVLEAARVAAGLGVWPLGTERLGVEVRRAEDFEALDVLAPAALAVERFAFWAAGLAWRPTRAFAIPPSYAGEGRGARAGGAARGGGRAALAS